MGAHPGRTPVADQERVVDFDPFFTAAVALRTVEEPWRRCGFVIDQQEFVELTHRGQLEILEDGANVFPEPIPMESGLPIFAQTAWNNRSQSCMV